MYIQGIYYQASAAAGPFSAASFANAGPNLIDGSVGDTTTGYAAPSTAGVVAGLIDLGAVGLSAVTSFEYAVAYGCGDSITLYYSTDGVAWTNAYSGTTGTGAPSVSPVITAATARWWQVVVSQAVAGASSYIPAVDDFRLYASGSLITVPPPAPTAPAAPTFGNTTTGTTSLPVNTQALTANATSEVVQVATDAAFTNPVAGSPFAVPTSGTTVNATGLTSGQTYSLRIGMVNGSGTTYGPAQSVKFDTTGPVYQSCTVSASGTQVTFTNTAFSPPLKAGAGTPTLTLTGGACTLSNPIYGATTVTFTTSRTILLGETGTATIPAGTYTDSAVPTNNAAAAVNAQPIANNSAVPPPPAPANEQHFFSTGTLSGTYLDHNTNLPATAPFGEVQGIDFNLDWAEQLLFDAAQISIFATDVAFHDGKFVIKAQHVGITADQLCFMAGLQLNVTQNPVIETINAIDFPQTASLVFVGQDTRGRAVTVTLNRVVAKGFSIPFKLNDWAMDDVEFHCIKDANGVIGTVAMAR